MCLSGMASAWCRRRHPVTMRSISGIQAVDVGRLRSTRTSALPQGRGVGMSSSSGLVPECRLCRGVRYPLHSLRSSHRIEPTASLLSDHWSRVIAVLAVLRRPVTLRSISGIQAVDVGWVRSMCTHLPSRKVGESGCRRRRGSPRRCDLCLLGLGPPQRRLRRGVRCSNHLLRLPVSRTASYHVVGQLSNRALRYQRSRTLLELDTLYDSLPTS
ncbi:hypothetical protein OH76DRAFT_681536 [Lentinus brumalis]|uniref:Uncharacterized protein n=1 Tax=Lentinus brumalis TaxID=2498619 RepID=A0A371D6M6_9APHY|nr:hypothetical protein OH76DRAFT_681536 [Polyporus brumalis]